MEIQLACDCGNRDSLSAPLRGLPPCSAECGRTMFVTGAEQRPEISQGDRHESFNPTQRRMVKALMLRAWDKGHEWEHPMSGDRESDIDNLLDLHEPEPVR